MNKIPSEIWTKSFNYLLKFSKSLIIVTSFNCIHDFLFRQDTFLSPSMRIYWKAVME